MPHPLAPLVSSFGKLNQQLSEQNLALKQELIVAYGNPENKMAASTADTEAKKQEELNKSLTSAIESVSQQVQEKAELQESDVTALTNQIQPYLSQTKPPEPPNPVEFTEPMKTKARFQQA